MIEVPRPAGEGAAEAFETLNRTLFSEQLPSWQDMSKEPGLSLRARRASYFEDDW